MSDNELVNGLYPKQKHERAPDYVIGKLSINIKQFREWMGNYIKSNPDDDWVNIEMLVSKNGKPYAKLDTWKPEKKEGAPVEEKHADAFDDSIPF